MFKKRKKENERKLIKSTAQVAGGVTAALFGDDLIDAVKDSLSHREAEAKELPGATTTTEESGKPESVDAKERADRLAKGIDMDKELKDVNSKLEEVGHKQTTETSGPTAPERGLKENFTLELGDKGVPKQLERVFHMMAIDAIERDKLLGADGKFGEEEGAKSLNVAANLVELAIGDKTAGFTPETEIKITDEKGQIITKKVSEIFKVTWDKDQKNVIGLNIESHKHFNQLISRLHDHADTLWKDDLDSNDMKGAVAELNNIRHQTWQDIVHANGLEADVKGHDEIGDKQIKDFDKSDLVKQAKKLMDAINKSEEDISKGFSNIIDPAYYTPPENENEAAGQGRSGETLQNDVKETFSYDILDQKFSSQFSKEWPALKNMPAQDALDTEVKTFSNKDAFAKYLEKETGQRFVGEERVDMGEQDNRRELQSYLDRAQKLINDPRENETIAEYLKRYEELKLSETIEDYSEYYTAEDMQVIKSISHESGINILSDDFHKAFKNMPEDIQKYFSPELNSKPEYRDFAVNYLRVLSGNKESATLGFSKMFDASVKFDDVHIRHDGIVECKNALGRKGFTILMSPDKIGIDGRLGFNWMKEGAFIVKPEAELNFESVETARAKVHELADKWEGKRPTAVEESMARGEGEETPKASKEAKEADVIIEREAEPDTKEFSEKEIAQVTADIEKNLSPQDRKQIEKDMKSPASLEKARRTIYPFIPYGRTNKGLLAKRIINSVIEKVMEGASQAREIGDIKAKTVETIDRDK